MSTIVGIDRAKTLCKGLAKDRKTTETEYHVIRANQTMNLEHRKLGDEHLVIVSGTYVVGLKSYWEAIFKQEPTKPEVVVDVMHTEKVGTDEEDK